MLESFEQTSYSLDTAQAKATELGHGAHVVDSNVVSGLTAGYWAVIGPGSYSSRSSATARCADFGRSAGGSCYPRQVG